MQPLTFRQKLDALDDSIKKDLLQIRRIEAAMNYCMVLRGKKNVRR